MATLSFTYKGFGSRGYITAPAKEGPPVAPRSTVMPTLKLFYVPTCLLSSNLKLVVVALLPGVLGGFVQYICDACTKQEPKRQGRRGTHTWCIMAIDCNAPAFLTPDKNIRLA